jgi:hypothetical protein
MIEQYQNQSRITNDLERSPILGARPISAGDLRNRPFAEELKSITDDFCIDIRRCEDEKVAFDELPERFSSSESIRQRGAVRAAV